MGVRADKDSVIAYVPRDVKEDLRRWGAEDDRSISYVAGRMLEAAVKRERKRRSK